MSIVTIDTARRWHDEHVRFGRVLDLVDMQLAAFHAAGEPDYDLIYDIVQYLREYGDRFHHPREDAAFARLAQRDPGMQMVLNRLLQEHRVIAVSGDELLERLDDVAADVVMERTALEAAASTYLVYYRHHIATEEASVLPAAKALLTANDWGTVVEAAPLEADPLFGENFDARYERLRQLVIEDAAQA